MLSGLRSGAFEDVCVTLAYPDGPFPGASASPPQLVIDDEDEALQGQSFVSRDGGLTFAPLAVNLQFSLGFTAIDR